MYLVQVYYVNLQAFQACFDFAPDRVSLQVAEHMAMFIPDAPALCKEIGTPIMTSNRPPHLARCYTFIVMQSFRDFEAGPDPFGRTWQIKFKWLQTAISLRHSDSVDVKFILRSDDTQMEKTISLRHPDLLELSEKSGRPLTDPWCSRLAALHLQDIIETGEDMEKSLVTPSLEQLARWNSQLFAAAPA